MVQENNVILENKFVYFILQRFKDPFSVLWEYGESVRITEIRSFIASALWLRFDVLNVDDQNVGMTKM